MRKINIDKKVKRKQTDLKDTRFLIAVRKDEKESLTMHKYGYAD